MAEKETSSVPINVGVLPGKETVGTFIVRNLGDTPLTGFAISVEGGDPAAAARHTRAILDIVEEDIRDMSR